VVSKIVSEILNFNKLRQVTNNQLLKFLEIDSPKEEITEIRKMIKPKIPLIRKEVSKALNALYIRRLNSFYIFSTD
jgi:hypothetical protein